MSQEEITKLKEEFFKEIRALEKKLNVQIAVKLKEITEKNDSFIQKVELLSKNNKILTDLISSKNLDSHKINELENFRKKVENMILSHEIRIALNAKLDDESIKIREDEVLKTYLHELGHCFNYYFNNEYSEEFANAFQNFMYEYLHTKE